MLENNSNKAHTYKQICISFIKTYKHKKNSIAKSQSDNKRKHTLPNNSNYKSLLFTYMLKEYSVVSTSAV